MMRKRKAKNYVETVKITKFKRYNKLILKIKADRHKNKKLPNVTDIKWREKGKAKNKVEALLNLQNLDGITN